MKIGVNPLSWSNDDLPSLGSETSLEQCLSEGKAVGFEGFELGNKFPREPKVLANVLQKHGLCLASGWFTGGILNNSVKQEIERLKPHCELLAAGGSQVIIYCDTTGTIQGDPLQRLSSRKKLTDEQWPEFCDKISALATWAKVQNMPLAYHFHMGTLIQNADEVDRLMAYTSEDLKLLLDTGHAEFAHEGSATGDALYLAKTHLERIAHVHLKDIRKPIVRSILNRDASFIDAILAGAFTVPGDGDLAIDEIIQVLVAGGYDDWLIVEAEQDPSVAPSVAMVSKAFAYIRETLEKCKK